MPRSDFRTSADDSILQRIRPLSGATAPYLFRLIECEELGAWGKPAQAVEWRKPSKGAPEAFR